MTLPSASPQTRIIEIGSSAWCWDRLEANQRGSLGTPFAHDQVVPVSYVVDRGQILVLDPADGAGTRAPEREMSVEITGTNPQDGHWLVRATGVARPARAHEAYRDRAWPALEEAAGGLLLSSVRIRGYHELGVDDSSTERWARDRHPSARRA